MMPHAKLVLLLLIATFKLPIVLTGDPLPDVEPALHDDLRDPAISSTSKRVDSLAWQKELADDGREVPKRLKGEGNVLPRRKGILPPRRNYQANEMDLEYTSLEALLDALPTHLSETSPVLVECNLSLMEFKNVLERLRNYQASYLRAVPESSQQAPGAIIEDLREIFHSITFRHPSEYLTEHDGKQLDNMHRIKTLHVKTTFERCVFKTLDYLYNYQRIDRAQMNSFFNAPETLQRTAKHLTDLFAEPKLAFTADHTFIPEINFLLNNWHTEHLHRCLKDLDEQVEQQVLYETLKSTIHNLRYFEERVFEEHKTHVRSYPGPNYEEFTKNPASSSINDFVCNGDFLQTFQRWSSSPSSSSRQDGQTDLLRYHIGEMMKLFVGKPHQDSEPVKTYMLLSWQKTEILLNYYILRFIMQYANSDLKKLINELTPSDFGWKFRWTTLRLGIRQLVERRQDYYYFSLFPQEARSIIPRQVSRPNPIQLRKKIRSYESDSVRYLREFDDSKLTSDFKTNPLLQYIEALSNGFKEDLNSWLQPHKTFSINPGDKNECDRLQQHLQVSYNMLDLSASQFKRIDAVLRQIILERME